MYEDAVITCCITHTLLGTFVAFCNRKLHNTIAKSFSECVVVAGSRKRRWRLSGSGNLMQFLLYFLPTVLLSSLIACCLSAWYDSAVSYVMIAVPFVQLMFMLMFWCCTNNNERMRRAEQPSHKSEPSANFVSFHTMINDMVAEQEEMAHQSSVRRSIAASTNNISNMNAAIDGTMAMHVSQQRQQRQQFQQLQQQQAYSPTGSNQSQQSRQLQQHQQYPMAMPALGRGGEQQMRFQQFVDTSYNAGFTEHYGEGIGTDGLTLVDQRSAFGLDQMPQQQEGEEPQQEIRGGAAGATGGGTTFAGNLDDLVVDGNGEEEGEEADINNQARLEPAGGFVKQETVQWVEMHSP